MRVNRLEIFGFKSFMDRVILPFEPGITAVVGPNGCGKSNVVDSLRWVLGETRARSLRGGVLEDVIFNGTDKLRPLGLAEVTLTLRSSDESFFGDLVSPAMEAELLVDQVLSAGNSEQGFDTVDDCNANADGDQDPSLVDERPILKIIEGKRGRETDQVVSDKPQVDCGEAGAQRPGAVSLANRFSWLRTANEVQVTRRLYRSGESEFFINRVACRLKDIKDLFRAVGLSTKAYTIVAQNEVLQVVTAKAEERRQLIEEAAGVLGFRDKISAANRRLEDTLANTARLGDIVSEVSRQVNSLRRQAARARNRQALKERIFELDSIIFRDTFSTLSQRRKSVGSERNIAKEAEARFEVALQAERAKEQEGRSELVTVDLEGDQLRSKIESIREDLDNRARERSSNESRLKETGAFISSGGVELERLEERKGLLLQRQSECEVEMASLQQTEQELAQQIRDLQRSEVNDLQIAAKELECRRLTIREKEQAIRGVRDRLIACQSKLSSIKSQLIVAAPINQLKKTIGGQAGQLIDGVDNQIRLLVDGINVPTRYAKAVQAILAERAGFLVTAEPLRVARSFLERTSQKDTDFEGVALGVIRAGQAGLNLVTGVPFQPLLELITVENDCLFAAEKYLGSVFLVDDLEQALSFIEHSAQAGKKTGVTLVTMDGDILTDDSFYTLRHEGGLVQLKSEAISLEDQLNKLQISQDELVKEKEALSQELSAGEARYRTLLDESRKRQEQIREMSNRQGNLLGRLDATKRLIAQIKVDFGRNEQQIAEVSKKVLRHQEEQQAIREKIAALVPEQEVSLKRERDLLSEKLREVERLRKEGYSRLAKISEMVDEQRKLLDQARSHTAELELVVQKLGMEDQHLRERIVAEYGEELLQSLLFQMEDEQGVSVKIETERRDEYLRELSALKARILREGEVDMMAIEEYEREKARLDDLESQKRDLDQAAVILKKTIEKLTDTSQRRFIQTFEAVSRNFSQLVPRLFGGGKGSLELTDPGNPLESGVEIVVRPPGKKLKSIELLSGGEKALAAVALILGMFMERPSPICVLDEVDAPLDDANLVRFLSLIKEMSTRTQFLMITHNKQTMSAASKLIGITMEEPGATKIITVSLDEAVQQVA